MGNYSVPEHIRKLKPKGSIVKFIHGGYYVYEHSNKKDENGKWKTVSGKLIGKIDEELGFIPNDSVIKCDEISTLEYGQYSLIFNCTQDIFENLKVYFNPEDACRIYLIAMFHFVNKFVPAKNIKKYYDQSYFSFKYPKLSFGEASVSALLDDLGRKQDRVLAFEQFLISGSSGEIAIDGHVIPCSSHENDLAEDGYKFDRIKDSQINVMMGYDINTLTPLFSRIYQGSNLDKISIKDTLIRHQFNNVLFVIDRGFYSTDNIYAFSQNGNHYIIPLSPNLKEYKNITDEMKLDHEFIYENNKAYNTIEYKEYISADKKTIVYRDMKQNAIDRAKYLKNMEINPEKYSQEKYDKVKDYFGVIVLQSSLKDWEAKEIYSKYKSRWKIETYYNYVKNDQNYGALEQSDYYKLEGLAFIMLINGLIHAKMSKLIKERIKGKTVEDCILDARFIKIHRVGKKWSIDNIKKKTLEMFEKLEIDLIKEYNILNKIK